MSLDLEQQIVLRCLNLDSHRDEWLYSHLMGEVNWLQLRKLAMVHFVVPQVHRCLNILGGEFFPPDEVIAWKTLLRNIAIHNIKRSRKMLEILDVFAQNDIPVIPFKGPIVAIQVYGDLAMRHFNDIDILIHPQDFHKTFTLLQELDCYPVPPEKLMDEATLLATCYALSFRHPDGTEFEIHWQLSEGRVTYPIGIDRFWQDLSPVSILGKEVQTFNLENAFLLLSMHGMKHQWNRLKWIADMIFFVQAYPNLDWANMLAQARKDGFRRIVLLSLSLAKSVGGTSLPAELDTAIYQDAFVRDYTKHVCQRSLAISPGDSWSLKVSLDYLRSRERCRDKFYFIFERVFKPNWYDQTFARLPRYLYPLYYLIRPVRLGFESIRKGKEHSKET